MLLNGEKLELIGNEYVIVLKNSSENEVAVRYTGYLLSTAAKEIMKKSIGMVKHSQKSIPKMFVVRD